jgi:predicted ATPase/class 3 adenylate cyclase
VRGVTCPRCGAATAPDAAFCPRCGAPLATPCPQCGAPAAAGQNFCQRCGHPLGAAPAAELGTPEAERRQLTVMFCDLVGSTALAGRLDPEELRAVIRQYQEACARVIARCEGHIAQYLGDGLLVYFGYPRAHEDDARRAVRAGLGIVDAVREANGRTAERGLELAVRIGIHTGSVVVGRVGGGDRHEELAIGETPNLASRLQGVAEPDTVLISAATHRLVRATFVCESLGTRALRGAAQPLDVYRARAEAPALDDVGEPGAVALTPLVGREQEVGLLLERWELVRDGTGQLVVLSGEAGIGKSRLLRALKERLADEPHTLLESRCSPDARSSALFPAIELLRRLARIERGDSPEAKLAKLTEVLLRYRLSVPEMAAPLGALLSLPGEDDGARTSTSPQARKHRMFETILHALFALAGQQPLLLIVEDLHWVDPSTLELIELLVDQVPTARIFTLFTCRPEFRVTWPSRTHVTQITLNRLTRKQTHAIIERLVGGKRLPAEVQQQITAKTDGIPLFVEELTKAVLESDLLREEMADYALARPLGPLAIPATLHDSLMARLDRLDSAKAVAQVGAVLGRQFTYDLLQAVSSLGDGPLRAGLERLLEAELLHQRGIAPSATYVFKHGLVQDAAYQSLLKSTRQHYHRRTAEALVERFPETVEGQPELVAHHFTEAGLAPAAIAYWRRAGQHAIERSANVEASGHLRTALELSATRPDTVERQRDEITLHTMLGAVLMASRGYAAPEVGDAYVRARALCERLGEAEQLFTVLRGLWGFRIVRAELRTAHELGERCLAMAERATNPAAVIWAHYMLGMTALHLGELTAARDHLQRSLASYDPGKRRVPRALQDPGVACLSYSATTLWLLGYPEQAFATSREALALARTLQHPFSLAYALNIAAAHCQRAGDPAGARAMAEHASAISAEHGIPYFGAWGPIMRGWALTQEGRHQEGIELQREGLAAYVATGAQLARPYFLGLLAESHGAAARPREGLAVLDEALVVANRTGEVYWNAELHRLRGELILAEAGSAASEACFRQALETARRQQATSLELRAAMSLGRLWRTTDRKSDGRRTLAEVYGRFTEGLDTRDLTDARRLLEELA